MKYIITFLISLFVFSINANAQIISKNMSTTKFYMSYAPKVKMEGNSVNRFLDISTMGGTIDCSKNPELCNVEIPAEPAVVPGSPADPSEPGEGAPNPGEGQEPAEGGKDDSKESTASTNSYLPSRMLIQFWIEGDTKEYNRYCVWTAVKGKWQLSKEPGKIVAALKKEIYESAKMK